MMLLPRPDFAPPGPPPPVVIKALLGTAIKKAIRKDKDAGNSQDLVKEVAKINSIEEEKLIDFIKIVIVFVQTKADADVPNILRLPEEESEEGKNKKDK